jgi:hypothetical protein
MIAVLVILVVAGLIVAAVLSTREEQPSRRRLPERDVRRFQGRGAVRQGAAPAAARPPLGRSPARPVGRPSGAPATPPVSADRRAGQRPGARRPLGRRPQPGARFGGTVRSAPNAVGLACGRPISECQRGADCLCRG